MARVTVEDCVEKVESRFELVAVAAQRAKAIASGAPLTIDRDGEKNSVLSLREIASENVSTAELREQLVQSFQKPSEFDDVIEGGADEQSEGASLIEQEISDIPVEQEAAGDAVVEGEEPLEGDADDGAVKAAPADAAADQTDEGMFADENIEVDD
jgi:DNA-directed RNA polymerase subunit omega